MADPIVSDVKFSQSTQPGNGSQTSWEFNFAGAADTPGYISRVHVKAFRMNRTTRAVTEIPITDSMWLGPNTISVIPAVPATDDITIYRDTPKDAPLVNYTTGSIINEPNLDTSNRQSVYVAAEMVDQFLTVKDVSDLAFATAVTAISNSDYATTVANAAQVSAANAVNIAASAQSTAASAVTTASTASTNAATALATANGIDAKATTALSNSVTALATANGIDAKATTALSNSVTALATANTANATALSAKSTAEGIDAKATTALTQSSTALTQASTALSNSVTNATGLANEITDRTNAVAAEATARQAADNLLTPRTSATGGSIIPSGTTAQRPSAGTDHPIRYNSDLKTFEGYGDAAWGSIRLDGPTPVNAVSLTGVTVSGDVVIPSWARRITLSFVGLSPSATTAIQLQLGTSSGYVISGYSSRVNRYNDASQTAGSSSTTGILVVSSVGSGVAMHGQAVLTKHGATDTWVVTSSTHDSTSASSHTGAASQTLSGTLSKIRIGTAAVVTFTSGSFSALIE